MLRWDTGLASLKASIQKQIVEYWVRLQTIVQNTLYKWCFLEGDIFVTEIH